jgi:MFS family permease
VTRLRLRRGRRRPTRRTPPVRRVRSAESARIDRRYCILTASRFLPTGLGIPVLGLLMLSRGLSLAELGFAFSSQAVMVIILELPTGGLADALGRRPVLLVATALDVAALGLLLAAGGPAGFMAGMAVQGMYRALESGPLDAWYVDASLAADPGTDIEAGLARGGVALGIAISAGAAAAAGLASLPPVGGVDPLALPLVAALVFRVVDVAAIATLLTEVRPSGSGTSGPSEPEPRGRLAAARASVAATPAVVRTALGLLRATPALMALVAIELFWGAGLSGVEMFTGPRLAELLGDPEEGAAVTGLAAALAWSIAAGGSALTTRFGELVGGGPARVGIVLRLVQGAAVGVAAVVAGPAGIVAGYLGFYFVHGAANAVHYGMVHRLVGAEHRATIISAHSVATRIGGMGTGIGLGALATAVSIPAALGVAAVLLALPAPLYRIAGRGRRVVDDSAEREPVLPGADLVRSEPDLPREPVTGPATAR